MSHKTEDRMQEKMKVKTWHTDINNIVNLSAKNLIQNLHFYSRYAISYVWYPWFWWQPNILKICTEMVLCPSIPLQKFFLLQAVHMILKCPLNNFFWMTPYLYECFLALHLGRSRLLFAFADSKMQIFDFARAISKCIDFDKTTTNVRTSFFP